MTPQRPQPTPEHGRRSLHDHVCEKAILARERYGHPIDPGDLAAILNDREVVRYPAAIEFNDAALEPGEFAHAEPAGGSAEKGFRLFVHPSLREQEHLLPLVVAYHIVSINYGEIATCREAELFGATLLGMDIDDYYEALCEIADNLPTGCAP